MLKRNNGILGIFHAKMMGDNEDEDDDAYFEFGHNCRGIC